ncbi:methionyl-tRNA formyltransferase [Agarivorans sp. B2Z047]|uniref:formyltransferase family protein n=1 Tax=Agarivorans sp. B2Z047 TaxID=2652721 RepID=UPI00128D02E9|nr:methionyl-tRNA formyltransferase [Agarivorans sp. B2Z047]
MPLKSPLKVVLIGRHKLANEAYFAIKALEGVAITKIIQSSTKSITADTIPPDCDLIICAHNSAYIEPGAIAKCKLGAISYHPSLLPRHRGGSAVEWVIRMREPVTGGTVYWMDQGRDTGPIANQRHCFVKASDTARTLWYRELLPLGVDLLVQTVEEVQLGICSRLEQDEQHATWEPCLSV